VILLRPAYYHGRYLWQVVAVDKDGRERVISPPLSKKRAAKFAAWAVSPSARAEEATLSTKAG
jgi:hypothetical protein